MTHMHFHIVRCCAPESSDDLVTAFFAYLLLSFIKQLGEAIRWKGALSNSAIDQSLRLVFTFAEDPSLDTYIQYTAAPSYCLFYYNIYENKKERKLSFPSGKQTTRTLSL